MRSVLAVERIKNGATETAEDKVAALPPAEPLAALGEIAFLGGGLDICLATGDNVGAEEVAEVVLLWDLGGKDGLKVRFEQMLQVKMRERQVVRVSRFNVLKRMIFTDLALIDLAHGKILPRL